MQLNTINRVLRIFGLVLVVSIDTDEDDRVRAPTRLWVELSHTYDRRAKGSN